MTISTMHPLWFALSVVALPFLTACSASAQPSDPSDAASTSQRTVQVMGEGTVRVAPDRARVSFSVVTRAETPETAREQNAAASRSAMNAVRDLDIEEENLQMQRLTLRQVSEYNPRTREQESVGYEAQRSVVVQVDSLDLVPTLVARVVNAGANQLDGVDYDVRDRETVRNEALRQAALAARAKARLLAETLGEEIGAVQHIAEQSFSFPQPRVRMEASMMKSADAGPEPEAFAAGEIEVSATVQATFGLK